MSNLFNPPANPEVGATYKTGGVEYVYQADGSWESKKGSEFADINLTELIQYTVEAINSSVGYTDLGYTSVTLRVNATSGVADPADPLSTGTFDTVANAIKWLKDIRFRSGIVVTILLSNGVHLIANELEIDLPNVARLVIKGTLGNFDAVSLSFADIRTINSGNASTLYNSLNNKFVQTSATLRFSGSGSLLLSDANSLYLENLIIDTEGSRTTGTPIINVVSCDYIGVRYCLLRDLSRSNALTISVGAESYCSSVAVSDCVCLRSNIGAFSGCEVMINRVGSISNNGHFIAVHACEAALTDLHIGRSNLGIVQGVASNLSLNAVRSYDCFQSSALHITSCNFSAHALECERGLNSPTVIASNCTLSAYRGEALNNNALYLESSTAFISNSAFRNSKSAPGVPGGIRVLNSGVVALSCEYSGNDVGGYYVGGGGRFCNSGATGSQSELGNLAYESVSHVGIVSKLLV